MINTTLTQQLADSVTDTNPELHIGGSPTGLGNDNAEQGRRALCADNRCQRLRELVLQRDRVAEQTRQEVAAQLHDNLLQLVGLAQMRLRQLVADPAAQPVHSGLQAVLGTLERLNNHTRKVLACLAPPPLEIIGLVPALRDLAHQLAHDSGICIEIISLVTETPMPRDIRLLAYVAARELMVNAIKHAQAQRIQVVVTFGPFLKLVVSDDGRGFNAAQLGRRSDHGFGYGLLYIQERLELLGGSLEVDAAPHRGAKFTVIISPDRKERPAHGPASIVS